MELLITILWNGVFMILALAILVGIHEYGHFATARFFGVRVLRFSIGFGKVIWSRRDAQGTEFAVSALPLGGYVSMLGDDPAVLEALPESERQQALTRKPPWQRLLIAFAGPAVNLIFAVLIYWVIHMLGTDKPVPFVGELVPDSPVAQAGMLQNERFVAVDGQNTRTWNEVLIALANRIGDTGELALTTEALDGQRQNYLIPLDNWLGDASEPDPLLALGLNQIGRPAIVGFVAQESAASQSGLQPGDLILKVQGEPISGWSDLVASVRASPETALSLDVQRGQAPIQLLLTPERSEQGHGYAGVGFPVVATNYGVFEAIPAAIASTWDFAWLTLSFLKKMLFGSLSLDNIGGPLTIADVAGSAAEQGLKTFLHLLALLSITLGVLNLLPIPLLDGGHILYNAVEMVIRQPLPEKVQQFGMRVGLAMVLSFMAIAIFNDFVRYVLGG